LADYGAIGFGHYARGVGGEVNQLGSFALKLGVEFFCELFAGGNGGLTVLRGRICAVGPFGDFFQRLSAEAIENCESMARTCATISPITARASLVCRKRRSYARVDGARCGDGVHHGGESCERENVAGDFDGALFGGALDFLDALGMRHGADMPDVGEDFAASVTRRVESSR